MKNKIITGLQVIIGIVLVLGLCNIVYISRDYQTGEDSYTDLAALAMIPKTISADTTHKNSIAQEKENTQTLTDSAVEGLQEPQDDTVWPEIDFETLRQINPDVIGWIYIEDTKINYPITQGEDNDFYLNHLYDGTRNSAGCIFLDKDCSNDFSMPHSILYGHNLRNGTMFRDILGYETQTFYEEHPVALLITPTAKYKIEFFSAYVANGTVDSSLYNAWDLTFTEGEYDAWLGQITERSCFQTAVTAQQTDRVLTLSTCTYDYENARFVLHGILREQTDRPST